jgi:hypothetical protein
MLKFKNKDGKTVGVLKDSASQPEGEFMEDVVFKTEDEMVDELPPAEDGVQSLEEIEAEMKDAE